ncbi:zinc finger Y-chromosomal protein 1-like [Tribolium madens]|uniref:zinc finger Y-chromosomal protein 1-like n=1 Tax=Tribolium madens TaxID=41895 RepID=UPI001CF746A5|nr:zinc finger Y-chromosomal protein 1-like [Tribolium madens]XP_044268664.1 zinc finger Y-chromosomal protein 1-like [Tribolium madens]
MKSENISDNAGAQICLKTESSGACQLSPEEQEAKPRFCCSSPLERHNCRDCPFETEQFLHLKTHIKHVPLDVTSYDAIHSLKKYLCVKCDFKTYSKLVWLKHSSSSGHSCNINYIYKCCECSFEIINKVSELKRHTLYHHIFSTAVEWFCCTKCRFKTSFKNILLLHKNSTQHSDFVKQWSFRCRACPYETREEHHMAKHVQMYHIESTPKDSNFDHSYAKSPYTHILLKYMPLKHYIYKCEHCNFESQMKTKIDEHLKKAHLIDDNKLFECENKSEQEANGNICKSETNNPSLKKKRGSFACQKCEFKTNSEKQLVKHTKRMHNEYKIEWVCNICGLRTMLEWDWRRHLRQNH